MPLKCQDKGSFSIPIKIGETHVIKAMCDLGASINVMPYSVYVTLDMGNMVNTEVIIQLADRSLVRPEGVVEDVLVQINHLIFPADFYILKIEGDYDKDSVQSC